jgi:formylglycine-generating enzyme required for sulfatase activity
MPVSSKDRSSHPEGGDRRPSALSAGDRALAAVLKDMLELTEAEVATLSLEAGGWKTLDQVALESGRITAEQRDRLLKSYLERRVEEMRRKLLGAQLGSYHILEEIASGGMGIVFRARQESPMFTREVAIKFLLAGAEASAEERERFISEVKGLASLSHPSLVPIFDSGIEGDLYYFTMELVDGRSLADAADGEPLSLTRKVEIARDIALALAYLHEHGIVHRDVKPSNILLERSGTARLLDFGIAQFSGDARRRVVQAGTPHYMAPEVVDPRGAYGPIGPPADVYALGGVLYRLLLGKEVFEGAGGISQVLTRTLREPPLFPRQRGVRLPAALERIVSRCLEKKSDKRYPTAKELAADLDAFLGRRQLKAPLLAASVLLLAAGLAVFLLERGRPLPQAPSPYVADSVRLEAKLDEVRRIDGLELGLEGAELEGLRLEVQRIESAAAAVDSERTFRELERELGVFWLRRTAEVERRAAGAREAALEIGADVRAESLFRQGHEELAAGLRSRSDDAKAAFEHFASSRRLFEDAAHQAGERRKLEGESDQALSARGLMAAARDGVPIESLKHSAAARELYREARSLEAEAERRRGAAEYLESKRLFEAAREGFEKAIRLAGEGEQAFLAEERRLRRQLAEGRARLERGDIDLAARNLPGVLEALRRELEGAEGNVEAGHLEAAAAGLEAFDFALEGALEEMNALRRRAEESQADASGALPAGPLPRPLAGRRRSVAESLRTAEEALRRGEFLRAEEGFRLAARAGGEIREEAERLTAGMVWVEPGSTGTERIPGFWMDALEVTAGNYAAFLVEAERTGHRDCCPRRGIRSHLPHDWREQMARPELPVVGVALADARAYARWRGKVLPSRAMWELAARRGNDGKLRAYPYGDRFDARLTHAAAATGRSPGLAPARSFEAGASACGCLHLSGNAAEWALDASGDSVAYLMGGSYLCGEPAFLRADFGVALADCTPESLRRAAGFRCALEAEP